MQADGRPEADMVGYFNTLIRYYLHMDPDGMSDLQWAQTIAQLKHIRESEGKAQ